MILHLQSQEYVQQGPVVVVLVVVEVVVEVLVVLVLLCRYLQTVNSVFILSLNSITPKNNIKG